MTGGYLTIDLSNVDAKKITNGVRMIFKKGLYKYLEKNTKPIYFIFSDSILNYIFEYNGFSGTTPNQCRTFLLPSFIDSNFPGRFNFCLGAINGTITINTNEESILKPNLLYLNVSEDDSIGIGEF